MFNKISFELYCWWNNLCPIHLRLLEYKRWSSKVCILCEQEQIVERKQREQKIALEIIGKAAQLKDKIK